MYGRSIPLHAGPGSRVILSYLSDAEIEEVLRQTSPLRPVTPHTIIDRDALWREIGLVRKRGYALSYGDNVPDAAGVAFPVLDSAGRPHGALAVAAPGLLRASKRLRAAIPAIQEILEELGERTQIISASPIALPGRVQNRRNTGV